MPVLARTMERETDGEDTLVTVKVTSLANTISGKVAATRAAARALIDAGVIDPKQVNPVDTVFELGDIVETESQKIIEGEGPGALRTAEITFRVKR